MNGLSQHCNMFYIFCVILLTVDFLHREYGVFMRVYTKLFLRKKCSSSLNERLYFYLHSKKGKETKEESKEYSHELCESIPGEK